MTEADMVLSSSPGLDIPMTSGDSTGHPDQHDPCGHVALTYQYGFRWQPRLQASAHSSVVTGVTDINISSLGCFKAMNQDDLALSNSPPIRSHCPLSRPEPTENTDGFPPQTLDVCGVGEHNEL